MKFCTHIHVGKLQNGFKSQSVIMQGYICNICTVVNTGQNKTTSPNRIKFDIRIYVPKLPNQIENWPVIMQRSVYILYAGW